MTAQPDMTYYYTAYGLNIQSEIELPELLPSTNNKVDVEIILEKCPLALSNCLKKGVTFEVGTSEYLLDIFDVARFYVTDGKQIIIEPKEESKSDDIRLFLLGTCLGAILHQRQILPIHASAIVHEGEAILFMGKSGIGKSSIATAFRLKGHEMITDDVCPIKIINDKPYAIPGYPQSKLCEDAMKNLEIVIEKHNLLREGIGKRAVRFQNRFATHPVKIKAIYVLIDDKSVERTDIVSQNNSDKFVVLKQNIYRKNILNGMKQQLQLFNVASSIANNATIKKIRKSSLGSLQNTIELIEQDL